MFEKIYSRSSTVLRYAAAPFALERQAFLAEKYRLGVRRPTLRTISHQLCWGATAFQEPLMRRAKISTAQVVKESWRWLQKSQHRSPRRARYRRQFIREVTAWLHQIGRYREPRPTPTRSSKILSAFTRHMEERGFSPVTIRGRVWHADKFLQWYFRRKPALRSVTASDLDAFILHRSRHFKARLSIATTVYELRSFFRFAEIQGWCRPNFADAIESPRVYRDERLPSGPSWLDVKRLIASTRTPRHKDIRDRAIIMLFAIYGFRVGEVAQLTLDDIDWENDRLTVSRSKQGNRQEHPLSAEVGAAILRYLKIARPKSDRREVFLSSGPPYRPLSRTALHAVVNLRMKSLKIQARHLGPHTLRHSCATHLLAKGCSLREVGDHLGHNSANSTRVYAKVDMPHLRMVANFEFGDVL